MKKLNIFLLLSTIFTGHLISMEISEVKQEAPILNLPDEVVLNIIEREVRETINNWNDVFEEVPNVDISLFKGLAKTCKKFAALYQGSLESLNNFKNNKFKRLLENLKSEFLEANKNVSPEELNNRLANLLNNVSNFANSKEKLKNAVRLILAGADVNIQDNSGDTALMWATKKSYREIVKILINAGADVNAKDIFGNTALILASIEGNKEIVEMLIRAGADVNAKGNYNYKHTALMLAAIFGHKEVLSILINTVADVNTKDNYGSTALMWAARVGHKEIAKMLINAGANVNTKDNYGSTALDWAVREGHKEIVAILKKTKNIQNSLSFLCLVQ